MANSFTQGSFQVPLTSDQSVFASSVVNLLNDENYDISADKPKNYDAEIWGFAKQLAEALGDEYEDELRFDLSLVEAAPDDGIILSHRNGEGMDFDGACVFTQMLLERFNINQPVMAECAFTCDQPRAGEFGGGAAFITKSEIKWYGTAAWLRDIERQHDREKSGNPKEIVLTEYTQLNFSLEDEMNSGSAVKGQITYSPVSGISISVDGYSDATNAAGGEILLADYYDGNFDVRLYADKGIEEPTHHVTFEKAKVKQ